MKLFDGFEAVKFPEENLLFITHNGFLYYIYNYKYKSWKKYSNAGNDSITVENYQEISKKDLSKAMNGTFPKKETDFLRLCEPYQLFILDMINLLHEDYIEYMDYMVDNHIYHSVNMFLGESNIPYKSYLSVRRLFDNAIANNYDDEEVLTQIKELSVNTIGRDIYKREIRIVDGHDSSSYFWIMPVRVVDYSDTNEIDNVAEMRSNEISIEEYDVEQYLAHFLYKHFDNEIEANKKRAEYWDEDEEPTYLTGFIWYLTHNFYTFDSVNAIIEDISNTIDDLSSGKDTTLTLKLKKDGTETELIIDFYRRFIYRMKYMMKVGEEQGYNLISFMGP